VLRAARQLQETYARTRGARICLQKHIPSAAGLGGGSSDAATTLLALNHLWGLDLGLDALSALAAELGSDVPFFLHAPTALAQGRGERLASLPAVDGLWVVLAIPPVTIPQKTRTLYRSLLPADYTDGSLSLAIAADLAAGKGLAVDRLRNAFERQALSVYPAVASCYQALLQAGAPFARLSGSGPAVFTLVGSQAAAHRIVRRLTDMGIHSEPTYTIGREETVLAILQGDD
jgi:4-diphosphocytidyl-2-C-methyl-D-erythritol kinase